MALRMKQPSQASGPPAPDQTANRSFATRHPHTFLTGLAPHTNGTILQGNSGHQDPRMLEGYLHLHSRRGVPGYARRPGSKHKPPGDARKFERSNGNMQLERTVKGEGSHGVALTRFSHWSRSAASMRYRAMSPWLTW